MKKIILLSLVLVSFLFASCEYDNYDAPSVTISGNLTYNGKKLPFDGNSGRSLLKVVQTGYGKVDSGTAIQVDTDGKFTQLLFPGEYWLTPYNNQYPFEFEQFTNLGSGLGYDSIHIELKKNLEMDIEVIPYYEVRDYTASLQGTDMLMKFKVVKSTDTKKAAPAIKKVRLYVSTSSIVSTYTTCNVVKDVNVTTDAELEISMPIASYQNGYVNNFRDYAFCRVAIELENIPNYYLFSEVKKLEGLPMKGK
ncbi:DUF3823 domain-containing protein [Bacteroides sp.]|uniref:DUF3823 domain-containing protein n=1 Tax=Bacteroides sp. TaxID=29523 RepID=UPI00262F07F2|nr:DUF3823 domain-containing protein [Bacteroides sp.]